MSGHIHEAVGKLQVYLDDPGASRHVSRGAIPTSLRIIARSLEDSGNIGVIVSVVESRWEPSGVLRMIMVRCSLQTT